ncbi:LuxR family transcriptional regulator [Rhodococcus sp. WS4]|nr:LuxR family transcriptional regulator [Rhodococcus sp. WS4]
MPVPTDSSPRRSDDLPSDVTSFVGRRQIRPALKRTLATARLVTLTGPGGVGKTRLALRGASEVRRAFPDGMWFVELAPLESASLLSSTVANTLGLRGPRSHDLLADLGGFLAERKALLILDNCEHLVDACAELVTQLLRTCPGLHVLTTSRQALGCAGEHVLSVPPLSVPEAGTATVAAAALTESVSLFLDRARAVVPEFELTDDNVGEVVTICRYLEGIPLALELAAVRLRGLAPAQIAHLLQDRFQLLTTGPRGMPDRQRTLRSCIDWSYDLCTPDERALWANLAVFSGGFELDAVCAVEPDRAGDELLDDVLSLVEKSILIREEYSGRIRYRMLEVIRQYGEHRLVKSGRREALQRAHLAFHADLATRASQEWLSDRQVLWLQRLHREHSNFRSALQFCIDSRDGIEVGLTMTAHLLTLWSAFGLTSEGSTWLNRFLAASTDPTPARLQALHVGVWLDSISGHDESCRLLLEEATRVAHLLGGTARPVLDQARGVHALYSGEVHKALAHLESAAAGFRTLGDDYGLLQTLCPLGVACELTEVIELGLACHREVMAVSERTGEVYFRAFSLTNAGLLAFHAGDLEQAVRHVQDSLRLKLALDDRLGIAICLESLAVITASSNPHRAAILVGAARAAYTAIGLPSNALPGRGQRLDSYAKVLDKTLRADKMRTAVETGRGFDYDSAIAFALDEPCPARHSERHGRVTTRDTLTPREREVASLIADGLSNKEIGLQLVISQRTAESHVDHILAKLGFTSRTQVASWFNMANAQQAN